MNQLAYYFIIFLGIMNLISIIFTIIDKYKAIHHRYRISEKTLFSLGAIGGASLMYITMNIIRHKTRHKKFMISLPLFSIIHITILVCIIIYT